MNTLIQTGNTPGRPGPRSRPLAVSGAWKLLFCVGALLASFGAKAQTTVASYGFTQSNGTYTAITTAGGAIQRSTSGTSDDSQYTGLALGFTFKYAGTNYTTVSVTDNGFIGLGGSVSSSYSPLSNAATTIAAFGGDLNGNGSGTVLTQTIGSSPNRTFVVQWSNYQPYNAGGTNDNFQIQLNETTNVVSIVYGSFATTSSTGYPRQVGLTGASTADFNDRSSSSSWVNTNGGTSNSATVTTSSIIQPTTGLTFTYTPTVTGGCQPASQVVAGSITASGASIAFAAPATAPTNYTVTTSPATTTTTVTASPVTLTGLAANTQYAVTIVSNCTGPTTSVPTQVVFTTASATSFPASAYGFTQSNGTYTAITTAGGAIQRSTSGTSDDSQYTGLALGFTFNYTGTSYTTVSVTDNGFIGLGGSVSSSYSPLANAATTIAAFGRDLNGNGSGTVLTQTIGSSPNRTFVVQWSNYQPYNAGGTSVNFQIRLNETTNVINIVYGSSITTNTTIYTPQVGLSGATTADFNDRSSTTSATGVGTDAWLTTNGGTANSATVNYSSTAYPASGLTLTYTTPGTCRPVNQARASGVTAAAASIAFALPTPTATNYTLTLSPGGATQTVTASPFALTGLTASSVYTATIVSNCTGASIPTTVTFRTDNNCSPVTGVTVSAITTTGAQVAFTPPAGGGVTNYTVTTSPATSTQTVTASPATLSGLSPGTAYTVSVVGNCTAGGTSSAATASFTSAYSCVAASYVSLPAFESFENTWLTNCNLRDVPTLNWVNTPATGNNSWRREDDGAAGAWTSPGSGNLSLAGAQGTLHSARFHSYYTSSVGTLDFYVNMSSTGYKVLNFDYLNAASSGTMKVQVSTAGPGGPFTDIPGASYATQAAYSTKTVNLPGGATAGSATTVIRFLATGGFNFSSDIGLDNVIVQTTTCPAPIPTTVTNIAYNQATVSWTSNGGGTFYVSYGPTGFTPGSGMSEVVSAALPAGTTSYNITGLTASTGYDFYISQDCSNTGNGGGVGNYSSKGSFTTGVACPTPTGISSSNVNYQGAQINYTAAVGGGSFVIRYAPTGTAGFTATTGGTVVTGPAGSTNKVLSGLTASTGYTYYVSQDCTGSSTGTGTSTPSAAFTFTTTVGCPAPTTGTTTNVTNSSVTVNFSATAGGGTYTIRYAPTGTAGFTATTGGTVVSAPAGATSANLTGLTAATGYTYYVMQDCTGSATGQGTSAASSAATFTTNVNPPAFTTSRTPSITYTSIAGLAGTGPVPFAAGASTDDALSNAVTLPAGFAFTYLGTAVTGFKACTNGWMTVDPTVTSNSFSNGLGTDNFSGNPTSTLAPFWDDLVIQGHPSPTRTLANSIIYQISGTSPNRKLTVEWVALEKYSYAGPNLNFQVVLTETANTIEYRYGNMTGFDGTSGAVALSYSLGLNAATYAAINGGGYLALQSPNSNYFLNANAGTVNAGANNLSVSPACYSAYSFAPGTYATGTAPTTSAPANDNPAGAIGISLSAAAPNSDNGGFCATYSSANGTASTGIPVCGASTPGTADDDVFFTFTTPAGPGTSNITVYAAGAVGYDPVLQVLSGTPGSFTSLACVNATGTSLIETSSLTALPANTTYYVRVYDANTGSGTNGVFALAAYATPTPPANDECVAAVTLSATTTTCTPTTATTTGATASASVPTCTAFTPGTNDDDVWYKFTVATAGDYTVTVQSGSGFNAVLQTFTGACGALTATNCVNNTSTGGTETVNIIGATAGTTYYALVYHSGVGSGSGNFTICAKKACDAPTFVSSTSVTQTSADITFTAGLGNTSYTVTATPASGPAVTNTGAASPIALTGLTPNTTYNVIVQGNCNAQATSAAYSFTTLAPPPANDQCSGAIALVCGSNVTVSTVSATSTNDPTGSCTVSVDASPGVFYTFAGNNRMVTVSTDNPATNFDTKLFVYSGSCGALTCVGGVDDNGIVTFSRSIVRFRADLGTTYYIYAAGFSSNTGTIGLSVNCNDPANNLTVSGTNSNVTGSFNDVTVTGTGNATLGGATTAFGNVVVQSGGTLTTACQTLDGTATFTVQSNATLGVCDAAGISLTGATGAVQTTGARSFSNDANYTYDGTGAQMTGTGLPARVRNLTVNNGAGVTLSQATSVAEVATLTAGTLNTAGNGFTLLSRIGQGTALIVEPTGATTAVNGTATMQRAVDIFTSDNIGYHHYSSPVTSTTINDLQTLGFDFVLNPAYNTAAQAGTVRPFPTVFGYDDARTTSTTVGTDQTAFNKGFFSPTSGDAMPVGRGYTASVPNALLIDFVGTFNNGPVTLGGLARASADPTTGYSLVGNPYPAPLDWATMTAGQFTGGVQQAVYQYHATSRYTGFYTTISPSGIVVVPSAGSGRADLVGNTLLPAGSGFFAWMPVGTTSGSITLGNTNRATAFAGQPFFGRSAGTRPQLQLQVRGAGLQDELFVMAETAATTGYDAAFDAAKMSNTNGLNLAALVAGKPMAIDALPNFATTTVVPLTLGAPTVGTYTLVVSQLANLGTTRAYLRDAVTGTETLLAQGTQVPVTLTNVATATTRFSLVFRPSGALATAASLTAGQVSLYPNPAHASFTVLLPPVAGAKEVKATLLNALGQTVTTRTIALTAAGATAEFNTSSLAQGVYMLRLTAGNETLTQRVVVE